MTLVPLPFVVCRAAAAGDFDAVIMVRVTSVVAPAA